MPCLVLHGAKVGTPPNSRTGKSFVLDGRGGGGLKESTSLLCHCKPKNWNHLTDLPVSIRAPKPKGCSQHRLLCIAQKHSVGDLPASAFTPNLQTPRKKRKKKKQRKKNLDPKSIDRSSWIFAAFARSGPHAPFGELRPEATAWSRAASWRRR